MNLKSVAFGSFIDILIGGGVVWALMSKARVERYVLKRDLDIEGMYFFSPKSTAPVKGVIKAGSEFEVDGQYSSADYILFRTVVDRLQLMAASKPAPPELTDRRNSFPHAEPRHPNSCS
jgi:hypothetical protein